MPNINRSLKFSSYKRQMAVCVPGKNSRLGNLFALCLQFAETLSRTKTKEGKPAHRGKGTALGEIPPSRRGGEDRRTGRGQGAHLNYGLSNERPRRSNKRWNAPALLWPPYVGGPTMGRDARSPHYFLGTFLVKIKKFGCSLGKVLAPGCASPRTPAEGRPPPATWVAA